MQRCIKVLKVGLFNPKMYITVISRKEEGLNNSSRHPKKYTWLSGTTTTEQSEEKRSESTEVRKSYASDQQLNNFKLYNL